MSHNIGDVDVVMQDKEQAEAAANTQTQPVAPATATVKKEKKRKQIVGRSVVWKQFRKHQNEDGEWKGTCIYCQTVIAADSKLDGTTGMKKHMKRCTEVSHSDQTELSTYVNLDGSKTIVPWKFDQEASKRALALMIIEDELPFRFVVERYVTSNAYFDQVSNVASMLRGWEQSSDIELKSLAEKMHEKFDKYWGNVAKFNTLLYIAAVFDPRKKMDYVAFSLLDVHGEFVGKELAEKVKRDTERLYVGYWELYKKGKEHGVVGDTDVEKGGCSGRESICEGSVDMAAELINAREERFKRFKEATGGGSLQIKSELESYLQESVIEGGKSFSILDWWKKHAPRFPVLSKMAKDVLAVQVSTVASESAFSTGGRVLDPFRSSLTPMVVQALICAQDWFRTSRQSMKLEEDLADLEQLENEYSQMSVETTITEM